MRTSIRYRRHTRQCSFYIVWHSDIPYCQHPILRQYSINTTFIKCQVYKTRSHRIVRHDKYQRPERYCVRVLAAEPGFEPGMNESESLVLPLHHSAIYPSHCAVRSAYNTRLRISRCGCSAGAFGTPRHCRRQEAGAPFTVRLKPLNVR